MSRIRRVAATFAFAAMTLSVVAGALAGTCVEAGNAREMAMMTHGGHDTPTPGSSGDASDDGSPSDCPMSRAAVSSCGAPALLARPTIGVLPAALTAERVAADTPHVPASHHALGLFRPPIA